MTGRRPLSLDEVNSLDYAAFTSVFGGVVEACPVVAAAAWDSRPFSSAGDLHEAVCRVVDAMGAQAHVGVLRVHPDLAGRLAAEGGLSAESANEQRVSGLTGADEQTKAEVRRLNELYQARFGFPFVICVRENKLAGILAGMRARLGDPNTAPTPAERAAEVATAIGEVKKICGLRIRDIVVASEQGSARL